MYTLRNQKFEIHFDEDTGNVAGIYSRDDVHHMNWVEGKIQWGVPVLFPMPIQAFGEEEINKYLFRTKSVTCTEEGVTSIYEKSNIQITATRQLGEDGYYVELYIVKNIGDMDAFLSKGRLGIAATFNDNYQDADTCLTKRCHTHLWCVGNTGYVNGVRMSSCPPHLGLAVTEGALEGYCNLRNTKNRDSNDRGDFILNTKSVVLGAGESFQVGWKLFFYEGDFFDAYGAIHGSLYAQAKNYTLYIGEEMDITAFYHGNAESISVTMDGEEIPYVQEGNTVKIHHKPASQGEKIIEITVNDKTTHVKILITSSFEENLKKRAEFITQKQQYHKTGSHLDGAYLIYDKETKELVYDSANDHNGGRERIGMGVVVACYLQEKKDEELMESLMKYVSFVKRELFDSATGEVYNDAPRNNSYYRLYNYPWAATLWIEMFRLTKEKQYLHDMYKVLNGYYNGGGDRFYAIGIPMKEAIDLLNQNQLVEEANDLLQRMTVHGENLINNSLNYPAHEVKYEQSIVGPAVSYLLQLYQLTKREEFLKEGEKQLKVLQAFGFKQPDYHLNEIAVRHWDGYWFGKSKLLGDTFPHYWSVLSGDVFARYSKITGEKSYKKQSEQIFRNNLCLFDEEGFGSCAYLYSNHVNGIKGEFYDPWANDQDWALYYGYKWMKRYSLKGKKILTFGDSIVDGHMYKKAAFVEFVAEKEGMIIEGKYANNGAKVLTDTVDVNTGLGGMILKDQVLVAARENKNPDFIIFDGGTNDAYPPVLEVLGKSDNPNETTDTFAGAFRKTIETMRTSWPNAKIIYVAVHKLGGRDKEVQEKLHKIQMEICKELQITVANLYDESPFDANDKAMREKYSFDKLADGLPAPGENPTGTHPNFLAIKEFYVPLVSKTLRQLMS